VEHVRVSQSGHAGRGQRVQAGRRRGAQSQRRDAPLLAHALRPFILRRTKEQVARELPPKTEQTIFCELEPPQRKLYNELRSITAMRCCSGRDAGAGEIQDQVLEALLRLRQAACHPGLIDPKRRARRSAKLDVLLEQLEEVVAEGGTRRWCFRSSPAC
jgi:SNF2 family DNA or RNA helicase